MCIMIYTCFTIWIQLYTRFNDCALPRAPPDRGSVPISNIIVRIHETETARGMRHMTKQARTELCGVLISARVVAE